MDRRKVDQFRKRAFRVLYDAGWTDYAIIAALGTSHNTIPVWRAQAQLPPNAHGYGPKLDPSTTRLMYDRGASDGEIARHFSADQSAVTRWRQRRGLPANFERTKPIGPRTVRKAHRLLKWGATARQVAEEVERGRRAILRLRKRINHPGLRRTGVTNRSIRAQILRDPSIQERIASALGKELPRDVLMEASAELYLAVLDGRVAREQLKAAAPHFRSRAWSMCGSNFGPRSLDAQNDDGWSLSDALADPDALERLEEAAGLAYEMDD